MAFRLYRRQPGVFGNFACSRLETDHYPASSSRGHPKHLTNIESSDRGTFCTLVVRPKNNFAKGVSFFEGI
jgi:hypothetical protein